MYSLVSKHVIAYLSVSGYIWDLKERYFFSTLSMRHFWDFKYW